MSKTSLDPKASCDSQYAGLNRARNPNAETDQNNYQQCLCNGYKALAFVSIFFSCEKKNAKSLYSVMKKFALQIKSLVSI